MKKHLWLPVCGFLLYSLFSCSTTPAQKSSGDAGNMDLIAHWPMDEMQGSVIQDHSGNYNHVRFSGLEWSEDGGIVFKGVDDQHISVPYSEDYSFRSHGQFTVALMAKPVSSQGVPAVLRIGRTGASERAIIDISDQRPTLGPSWRFVVRDANNGASSRVYSGPVELDRWVQLAMTWDGKILLAYIDGHLSGNAMLSSIANDKIGIGIGGEPDFITGQNYTFSGIIRDVRIYRRALTEDEIRSIGENISPYLRITEKHEVSHTTAYF